jgi:AraC-like DNA-binding protein
VIVYSDPMDGLSTMLEAHRGHDAFVLRCEMRAPWSVRIADQAAIGLIVMVRGTCLVTYPGQAPVTLQVGDVALLKGTFPYTLADDAATPVSVVIDADQVCRALTSDGTSWTLDLRTRSWGNAHGGPVAFVSGTYESASQVSGRLLDWLPDLAVLRAPDCDPALLALLSTELARDLPGQDVVLNRYVDLVLVSALRQWFARPDADRPRWWSAQNDPLVGGILARMHDRPGAPWTLSLLAAEVGYSRASIVRRFTELVGQPPMAYLTQWRLALASDLLLGTEDTVEAVGRSVGYDNAFAFSSAFKRAHGVSPRAFRQQRSDQQRSTSS